MPRSTANCAESPRRLSFWSAGTVSGSPGLLSERSEEVRHPRSGCRIVAPRNNLAPNESGQVLIRLVPYLRTNRRIGRILYGNQSDGTSTTSLVRWRGLCARDTVPDVENLFVQFPLGDVAVGDGDDPATHAPLQLPSSVCSLQAEGAICSLRKSKRLVEVGDNEFQVFDGDSGAHEGMVSRR